MRTGITMNLSEALHDEPQHVERAARMQAIRAAIHANSLDEVLIHQPSRAAQEAQILAVHQPHVLHRVQQIVATGGGWIDRDTYLTEGTLQAAIDGAGAAIAAVEAVARREVDNAFALIRPPGHHATPSRSMGFCLFNNIAIAARHAIRMLGIERLAIVDYDVHHGNGTQDIFYYDGQVLFCSTHGSPLYPMTGRLSEIGEGKGEGTTMNIPLPIGSGDRVVQQAFEQAIIPALRHFRPEFILVSSGFDAHWQDPIGSLTCSVGGFAGLARILLAAADELCQGRITFILEGGYNVEALSASVVATLRVMLGRDPGEDPLGTSDEEEPHIEALLARLKAIHPLLK